MINLTEEDKTIILQRCRTFKQLELSSGSYFVKRVDSETNAFNELLGKKLADIFGIKCPDTYVTFIEGEYYVISENLRQLDFKTAIELGIRGKNVNACSLIDAGCYVDVLPNSLEIMMSFIKLYIYDTMFLHDDRNLGNFGIYSNGSKKELAIIDNENILKPETPSAYQKFHANFEFKALSVYDDFKLFLNEYSFKYLPLFVYYFEFITPEYFSTIIDDLDKNNDFSLTIKQKSKNKYTDHYQKLKNIYEEFLGRSNTNAR